MWMIMPFYKYYLLSSSLQVSAINTIIKLKLAISNLSLLVSSILRNIESHVFNILYNSLKNQEKAWTKLKRTAIHSTIKSNPSAVIFSVARKTRTIGSRGPIVKLIKLRGVCHCELICRRDMSLVRVCDCLSDCFGSLWICGVFYNISGWGWGGRELHICQQNGVLGHDSALYGITGPGTTWVNKMNFCSETFPWCRINCSTC